MTSSSSLASVSRPTAHRLRCLQDEADRLRPPFDAYELRRATWVAVEAANCWHGFLRATTSLAPPELRWHQVAG